MRAVSMEGRVSRRTLSVTRGTLSIRGTRKLPRHRWLRCQLWSTAENDTEGSELEGIKDSIRNLAGSYGFGKEI